MMDAVVREYLNRAHQIVLDLPRAQRGPAENSVLSLWDALTYAMMGQPFDANEHAGDVPIQIQLLNKAVQIAAEKERAR